jgi:hypothetical protein
MTTPFLKAGYTNDTKFKFIGKGGEYPLGTLVWIYNDFDTLAPKFTDGKIPKYLALPGHGFDIEVLHEETTTSSLSSTSSPTITHNLSIKGITHVLTTEELCEVLSIIEAAVG